MTLGCGAGCGWLFVRKVLMNTFCDPFPTPAPPGIYMDPIQQSFCVTHRRDFSATSLATFRAAEMASNAEY